MNSTNEWQSTKPISRKLNGITSHRVNEENFVMNVNKDVFENKWEQIRAQSRVWWGLFSEDDLNKVAKAPIKRDKYAMMLRVKYGYTQQRAREEINQRITDLECNPPRS